MARPRFSEMLVDRRRQLGLSIAQASQVLRLKQQVLMAFEEGDFANMPKSGYAQGMLYFLFAPQLTLFSPNRECNYICASTGIDRRNRARAWPRCRSRAQATLQS